MRAALYQSCTGTDPAVNAAALAAAVETARAGGADMLFTPEMSNLLDRDRDRAPPVFVRSGMTPRWRRRVMPLRRPASGCISVRWRWPASGMTGGSSTGAS